MSPPSDDLRAFYACPLGRMIHGLVRARLHRLWSGVAGLDVAGLDVAGIGYAAPYLGEFRPRARRVLDLAPARQGAVGWRPGGRSLTALVQEDALPLPDAALDRVLLVHGLEASAAPVALLREVWRVLAPGGRLLVAAPNRGGLWALRENTPLGRGCPWSRNQLSRLLEEAMFVPESITGCLYAPPVSHAMVLRSAPAWERAGARFWPGFAGLLLADASKRMYAVTAQPRRVGARRRLLGAKPASAGPA